MDTKLKNLAALYVGIFAANRQASGNALAV